MLYEDWKKEIEKISGKKEFDIEKIPAVVKRCPKCNSLGLEFDVKTGKIHCTKCGFEEWFKVL